MTKTITLLAGIMLAVDCFAQQGQTRVVPRPSAPGFEFSMAASRKAKKPMPFRSTKKAALSSGTTKTASFAAKQLRAAAGISSVDSMLCTETINYVNGSIESRDVYSYDEYGHIVESKKYDSDGNLTAAERYTYVMGDFNYWTTKTTEIDYSGNGDYIMYSKEVREIDANKNVTSRKIYTRNAGALTLEEEYRYDYSYPYIGSGGKETYGALVYSYINYGRQIDEYAYLAAAKDYVGIKRTVNGIVTYSATLGDNYVTTTYYQDLDDSGTYKKYEEATTYYSDGQQTGYKTIYYDSDGEITDAYGSLNEEQANTPSQGYTTRIDYEFDEDNLSFKPTEKYVSTIGYGYSVIAGEESYYKYSNGNWILEWDSDTELLKGDIYRYVYSEYNNSTLSYSDTTYIKCRTLEDASGSTYIKQYADVSFNADGSYSVRNTSSENILYNGDSITVELVFRYDASDKLISEMAVSDEYVDQFGETHNTEAIVYVKQDGVWTRTKTIENIYTSGSNTVREVIELNDNGYPVSYKFYSSNTSFAGGKEILWEETKYTYTDNGYTKEEYEYVYNSLTGVSTGTLVHKNEYYLLSDGTYQHTEYDYDDESGELQSASRTELTSESIRKNYYYDSDTDSFVFSDMYCEDITETTADGTVIIISRELDENNKPVNTSKNEYKTISTDNYYYYMNAEYSWDSENGKWVGSNKYESIRQDIDFDYTIVDDPLNSYNDDYFDKSEKISNKTISLTLSGNTDYGWNDETGDWTLSSSDTYDVNFTDENTLTITEVITSEYSKQTMITTYRRDAAHRLLECSTETRELYLDSEETQETVNTHTKIYTLNANGLLEQYEKKSTDSDNNIDDKIVKYVYSSAKVYPTNIEQTVAASTAITVSGRTICANDGGRIVVYSTDGVKIAEAAGEITVPAAGVYIVRTKNTAKTIAVK